MGTSVDRRDGTQIQLLLIKQLVISGGKAPLYTRTGLMFQLGLHQRTLSKALKELEKQGVIQRCTAVTPRGEEVQAVKLTDEADRLLRGILPTIGIFT
ncbi:MAG: hypothetical protein ABC588_08570 [Candidatus Methanosuratincola petrocarbonis]